jgi:hypothetical protein
MNKFLYAILFFTVVTVSCKSSKNSSFTFNNGNKTIELQVPQNQIILDTDTFAKIKITNINPKELAIVGVGVSIRSINESECNIMIRTRSNFFVNKEKFELNVYYKENGERIKHTFYVPLKKSVNNSLNR